MLKVSAYYLSLIATQFETLAGASTTGNLTPTGYWKRIAAATESLAGASTTSNNNLTGYALRACRAIVTITGYLAGTYSQTEAGYLQWLVDALEFSTGLTTTGSLERRLLELSLNMNVSALGISGTPPAAEIGVPYSWFPTVTGGIGTKTFAINSGSLPAWASLNAATGEITGTPV